jgi:hypothetical protein
MSRGKEIDELKNPFKAQGYNPSDYLYISEALLAKPYYPLRPRDHQPLEEICKHFGCYQLTNVELTFSWPQINSHGKEISNILEVRVKKVS